MIFYFSFELMYCKALHSAALYKMKKLGNSSIDAIFYGNLWKNIVELKNTK